MVGVVAVRLVGVGVAPLWPLELPDGFWDWFRDYRYTAPLLLGILGMVLIAFPVRSRSGKGVAELTPRTPAPDHNHERDVHIRTVRTRNVLVIGTGALLVHLALIFGSLAWDFEEQPTTAWRSP